jgi:hypothetical protein
MNERWLTGCCAGRKESDNEVKRLAANGELKFYEILILFLI